MLQGVKQLVSCLKQNSTLQKLDLENKVPPVPDIAVQALDKILNTMSLHT